MKVNKRCTVTALVAFGTTIGLNQHIAAQQSLSPPQQQASIVGHDGMEVLTRGPVHEAFAETISFDPDPGIVAPQSPPAEIEEVPPQQKPEGKNLAWIPGYWAWDDERNDYLWISGIWRATSGSPMGAWLLGPDSTRLSMDFGLLGRCQRDGDPVLARAAGDRRRRSEHSGDFPGSALATRLLGLAAKPICLAPRILGGGA
jgi:hypothetical protein